MNQKIGIGIITCNREDLFEKAYISLPEVDEIVVVNDGKSYGNSIYSTKFSEVIQHKKNKGISRSKNDALKYLLSKNCEHIFLSEDDIAIKDHEIINEYIKASYNTNILHFNYGYHGPWNKDENGPIIRRKIDYPDHVNKVLTGAFSYYRRNVLENVGMMDTFYKNVLEHVDHTYRIIKAGYHPPFKWFADLESSYYKIIELDPELENSVIRKQKNIFNLKVKFFEKYFKMKFGYTPGSIPDSSEDQLISYLGKNIGK